MSALLELFCNRFIFMIIFVYSSRWPGLGLPRPKAIVVR